MAKTISSKHLSSNIKWLMKQQQLTFKALSEHTGVPATTLKRLCNDETANPTLVNLLPLAQHFDVNIEALLTSSLQNQQQTSIVTSDNYKMLPIIKWQDLLNWPQHLTHTAKNKTIATNATAHPQAFAVKVPTSSSVLVKPDTQLIIEPTTAAKHLSYVLIKDHAANRIYLAQIIKLNHQEKLRNLLSAELETISRQDTDEILGVVVEMKL